MTVAPRPVAVVVCAELTAAGQLDPLLRSLVSAWSSGSAAATLFVPFGASEPSLVASVEVAAAELDLNVDPRWHGTTRVQALNAGLALCRDNECDALLLDPGVEVPSRGLISALQARIDTVGRPAGVVGGRLLDTAGNVHRAGYWFSRLTRAWSARLQHAPADLVQAAQPCRCPVPDAFALVRYETLQAVGAYDERLSSPLDAIDFCLRVYAAGLECVLEPAATAICHSPAPERLAPAVKATFDAKWHGTDFSPWVPPSL